MTVRDGETGGGAKLWVDRGDDGLVKFLLLLDVFAGEESLRFGGDGDRVGDRVATGSLSVEEFARGSGELRSSRWCSGGEGDRNIVAAKLECSCTFVVTMSSQNLVRESRFPMVCSLLRLCIQGINGHRKSREFQLRRCKVEIQC